ncbi:C2 domain-containing protein [Dichotomocladium elegans]|nr:C2 domain-containing protein [Dichotomocladium elegans]
MLSEGTLRVTVHSVRHLVDVEHMGRNDPYVKLYLNLEEKDTFEKTETREDAGAQATWDETFELAYGGQSDLYVEVMDAEKGVDQIIGFAAIPLDQVPVSGLFDLYQPSGKPAGAIHLSLNCEGESPRPARSYINEDHLKIAKSLEHKALAGDIGAGFLAGALALGAGVVGNHLYEQYRESHPEEE